MVFSNRLVWYEIRQLHLFFASISFRKKNGFAPHFRLDNIFLKVIFMNIKGIKDPGVGILATITSLEVKRGHLLVVIGITTNIRTLGKNPIFRNNFVLFIKTAQLTTPENTELKKIQSKHSKDQRKSKMYHRRRRLSPFMTTNIPPKEHPST